MSLYLMHNRSIWRASNIWAGSTSATSWPSCGSSWGQGGLGRVCRRRLTAGIASGSASRSAAVTATITATAATIGTAGTTATAGKAGVSGAATMSALAPPGQNLGLEWPPVDHIHGSELSEND